MNQDNTDNSIDIFSILREAFKIYRKWFSLLIALSLIYGILSEFIDFIFYPSLQQNVFTIAFLIQFIILCWVLIAFIDAISKIYQGNPVSFKEAILVPKNYYFLFLAVSFSEIFMSYIGLRLLIIPGIYLGTVFTFANFLVVLEKKNYLDSFEGSFNLVRGRFWNVLLFNLVLVTFFIMLLFLTQVLVLGNQAIAFRLAKVLSIAFMPFFIISQVGLYLRIKDVHGLRT